LTAKNEATPLNVTVVAPLNVVPVITTFVPTGPRDGENPMIVGETVKLSPLTAVPDAVVTLIVPVVAAAGTVAVICVGESTA